MSNKINKRTNYNCTHRKRSYCLKTDRNNNHHLYSNTSEYNNNNKHHQNLKTSRRFRTLSQYLEVDTINYKRIDTSKKTITEKDIKDIFFTSTGIKRKMQRNASLEQLFQKTQINYLYITSLPCPLKNKK